MPDSSPISHNGVTQRYSYPLAHHAKNSKICGDESPFLQCHPTKFTRRWVLASQSSAVRSRHFVGTRSPRYGDTETNDLL